jgi:hypothetical protein
MAKGESSRPFHIAQMLKDYIDKNITKIGIIFNLDNHNESGSHWVSLFIDLEDKFVLYLIVRVK